MQPIFDSAHVCTYKNQKRYHSQRVIEIFELVVQPSHNSFAQALTNRSLCTSKEIEAATEAHEKTEKKIKAAHRIQEQRASRMHVLDQVAKNLRNRYLIKNTNNGKAYLLDAEFKPDMQYANARYIKKLKISPDLKYRIASECTSVGLDQFVFEAVSRWNVHSIVDQYQGGVDE